MITGVVDGPGSLGEPHTAVVGRDEVEPHPLRSLYETERVRLVRLAALRLRSEVEAEEVVQDAFLRTYLAWDRVRDREKALAYLRSAVLNGSRSRLRRRRTVEQAPVPEVRVAAAAEVGGLERAERERVLDAVHALPRRQRDCVLLRYYLDLTDPEIGATLGISTGSVKTHLHRASARLATTLGDVR